MEPIIIIKDLFFAYEKQQVLSGLSLTINKGDIMCIMGKNGCGKTTLIDCIQGFHNGKGSIKLNGEDISRLNRQDIAKLISYVQQISVNDSMLSVFDYLVLGRVVYKKIYETINQEDIMLIENVSKEMGIAEWMDKSVGQLSGGEKQKVMIARALVQNTPVIIMDEPTSALDFGNQALFLSMVRELNKKGKTILFTTHNPNHALALDATFCLMDAGKIVRTGKSRKELDKEVLCKVYGDYIEFITHKEVLMCAFKI